MKREIRLGNIVNEIKRNIKAVLVFSLLMAILLCGYSYFQVKNSTAGITYGSKLVLMMEREEVEALDTWVKDLTDENDSIIKSDAIINAIQKENADLFADESVVDIRNMIYIQGRTYGDVMMVYAVSDSQEKSNAICKSIEKNIATAVKIDGLIVSPIQRTSELGPSRVEQRDDYSNPERQRTMIRALSVPSFGASNAVKKLIEGFVFGLVCAVVWIFAAYVLKGTVRYENELRDTGIAPYGKISANGLRQESEVMNVAGKIFLGDSKLPITLIPYGCKETADGIINAVTERSKDRKITSTADVLTDPMARLDTDEDSEVIMVIKAGKMKIEEAYEEKNRLEEAGHKVKGAIIAE